MTQVGLKNHYNIKFLKGYGFSIRVKDSKIILRNCADPFKEPDVERGVNEPVNIGEKVSFVKRSERNLPENAPIGDRVDAEVMKAKDSQSDLKERKDDLSKGVKL